MSLLSRILAGLALAVLLLTAWLLGYLRQRAVYDLEHGIESSVSLFQADRLLHGPGGNTLVHFDAVEALVSNMNGSAYIRGENNHKRIVLSKLDGHGRELTIYPFILGAQNPNWAASVEGWRREPLGASNAPWGYMYVDVDRSLITSVNWSIGAIGLAIALILVVLLARLWRQETSLTRTTIELNDRRRELIRVERLALAGQLAAGLLHDLRKPVLNIEHAGEDLAEAFGDYAGAATALQDVRRQTRLFFQMLSDSQFERFVQSDRATEEYVDVLTLLDQSLALVKYERRGAEVLISDTSTLPNVLAHPFRLIQLFSNIILNAYQALAGRGRLVIEANTETIREHTMGRAGILITFTDDGPGIALESLPHVFEPFFTTKPEGQGTGLGLSICKLIVEDLRGRIGVDSRPGGPTQFRVWLPAAPPAEDYAP